MKLSTNLNESLRITTMNHALISEVIFTNDEAFTEVDIVKARMMLCVCKNAKHNKNIKLTFDKVKIQKYCKQITTLSSKKANNMLTCFTIMKTNGESDLYITSAYKARVMKIVTNLLKEETYIIEGVKKEMIIEQKRNIQKYITILEKIVSNYMIYEEIDEDDHLLEEWNRLEVTTTFKYNSYLLNMLVNHKKEKDIIKQISSKHYDKKWWTFPFIFT